MLRLCVSSISLYSFLVSRFRFVLLMRLRDYVSGCCGEKERSPSEMGSGVSTESGRMSRFGAIGL